MCQDEGSFRRFALAGILEYTGDEVVSSDFIHCPASSIFDAGSGMGLSDTFL